jgi:peroxiredoxin
VYALTLLAVGISACSGQKNRTETADEAKDATENVAVTSDNMATGGDSATVAADSVGYIVRVGDMAPDFTMKLTTGEEVTLSALRGKLVMLQFTASWCGVCRKEMPFIEREIRQKHKNNDNFVLMGIDRDEPLEKVLAFIQSTKVTYPMGLDPGADIFAKYAVRDAGITRNVLIDPSGRIVKMTRLYNEVEFASLVRTINEMLKPDK